MAIKLSLKFKLLLFLLVIITLVFGLVSYISSKIVRDMTAEQFENEYVNAITAYVDKTESIFNLGSSLADQMAIYIGTAPDLKEIHIDKLLLNVLSKDSILFAAGIAFAPYAYDPSVERYGPFYYTNSKKTEYIDLGTYIPGYRYTDSAYHWYYIPSTHRVSHWSRPFYSSVIPGLKVVTYSTVILREDKPAGVVVVDYSLSEFNKFLIKNLKSYSGRYLIIDNNLNYISHPDTARILRSNLADDEKSILSKDSRDQLISEISKRENGKIVLRDSSGQKLIHAFYSRVNVNGWTIILYEYEDQLLASVDNIFMISKIAFITGLVVILIFVFTGTAKALKPLSEVRNFLSRIVEGDYYSELSIKTYDEFEELAGDLKFMQNTLREREDELKRINAGLENMVESRTSELKAALEKNIKLGSAVENSPALIVITDLNFRVEYVNPGFKKITGLTPAIFAEKNWNLIHSGKLGKITPELILSDISLGLIYKNEIIFSGSGTRNYHMQVSAVGILSESGALQNLVFLWQDITAIREAGEELNRTAALLAAQNNLLNSRNKYISDSINYAKLIQDAILPDNDELAGIFKSFFFIYSPKDIVSGDFYWYYNTDSKIFFAVADCTGHGVPGAFMTFIGKLLLNEIVISEYVTAPDEILNRLNIRVIEELGKSENKSFISGMDVALIVYHKDEDLIRFSGANRNLLIFSNGELTELKGVHKSVGEKSRSDRNFVQQTFKVDHKTTVYLYSDGITDQNNPSNKKFGTKRLKEIINFSGELETVNQKNILSKALRFHQSDEEQRDDMTLFAIRFIKDEPGKEDKKVVFGPSFRGDDLIVIREMIADRFNNHYPKGVISRLTFTVLELGQNIDSYSDERNNPASPSSGTGAIELEISDEKIFITSVNMINNDSVKPIYELFDKIKNSDEVTLDELRKNKLKANTNIKSKGAGLGLLQIFLKSGNIPELETIPVSDNASILKLKCTLNINR